jgi:hypothetical protein
MEAKDSHRFLKIRKKPWYIWLLRLVWLTWIVFWAEVAWGSWKELEPRASFIALGILVFSLIVGILLWVWGYRRFRKYRS